MEILAIIGGIAVICFALTVLSFMGHKSYINAVQSHLNMMGMPGLGEHLQNVLAGDDADARAMWQAFMHMKSAGLSAELAATHYAACHLTAMDFDR